MNRLFAFMALLVLWGLAFAQDESADDATVSGRIIDQQTGEPIPFATVTVSAEDENVVLTGALTDETGRFVISGLAEGSYVLLASLAGYEPTETELLPGSMVSTSMKTLRRPKRALRRSYKRPAALAVSSRR